MRSFIVLGFVALALATSAPVEEESTSVSNHYSYWKCNSACRWYKCKSKSTLLKKDRCQVKKCHCRSKYPKKEETTSLRASKAQQCKQLRKARKVMRYVNAYHRAGRHIPRRYLKISRSKLHRGVNKLNRYKRQIDAALRKYC
jgi:hypothetical protein